MISASKLLEDRLQKELPFPCKNELDIIQTEFKAKGESVLIAWDSISLKTKSQSRPQWPESREEFSNLRKKLSEMRAREAAKRDLSISTQHTLFPTSDAFETPPTKKRSEYSDYSSPVKRMQTLLSMDKMPPHISSFVGSQYVVGITSAEVSRSIEITPANAWTAKSFQKGGEPHRYMSAPLSSISQLIRTRIAEFGQAVLDSKQIRVVVAAAAEKGNEAEEERGEEECVTVFDKVGASAQDRPVVVCGRIVCEGENDKLTLTNAMLEGVNGVRIKLDLTTMNHRISLFPGQYVVVEGVCNSGGTGGSKSLVVLVKHMYHRAPMTRNPSLVQPNNHKNESHSMWIVSGPYTSASDLQFDLLNTLLAQVQAEKPSSLILLGPFVDANHALIASGMPTIDVNGQKLTVDFTDVLDYFLKRVHGATENCGIQIGLVPSTDDVTHNVVAYPQPSMEFPFGFVSSHIFSLSNPCVVHVGKDLVLGVTNADVLFDFQADGSPQVGYSGKENMARLTDQLLLSQSFYPLCPPASQSQVDVSFSSEFDMEVPLDILVVPSKLQPFALENDRTGVFCVNPGKALTNKTKMTVCKLDIQGELEERSPLSSRIKAEFFTVG